MCLGVKLTLSVTCNEGQIIDKVTFNGNTLTANEQGLYEVTVVNGENVFEATYKSELQETPNENPPSDNPQITPTEKDGCGSMLQVNMCFVLIISLGVMLLVKKLKINKGE